MAITNMTTPPTDNDDDDQSSGPSIQSPYTGSNPPPPNPNAGAQTPAGMSFHISPATGSDEDATEHLIDYNDRFAQATPALFRDELVDQAIAVLISKAKPNPLLVGAPGVGKTHVVEDIARRIVAREVPDQLLDYTVYELPMSSLVSGASLVGQLEERLEKILDFAVDPDNKAILFIDEIHQLTDTSNPTLGKVAQMLKPKLARGDLHVIGATTSQEARDLDDDPAFKRRFSQLIVSELSVEQTAAVLRHTLAGHVAHYRGVVDIDDDPDSDEPGVIEAIVSYADEYNRAKNHRPDNALTLMDKSMAHVAIMHQKMVNQGLPVPSTTKLKAPVVQEVAVQLMTGLIDRTRTDYDQLRENLQVIKGQDHVIDEVVHRVRTLELGVFPQTTPASWLFSGPSGVGKTKVAEIVSESVSQTPPIVLNMAEYHDATSINRIIGSSDGYVGSDSKREKPLDSLESNPRQVIVLDEFEKAHRDVQNLFLAAFDKGHIDSASGKVIDLSKAIIVATTNAGRRGGTGLGFGSAGDKAADLSVDEIARSFGDAFPKELVGRFSYVTAFNKIDRETYAVALTEHYEREHTRIVHSRPYFANFLPDMLDEDVVNTLVTETYVAEHGVRPARRAVEKWISETILASV